MINTWRDIIRDFSPPFLRRKWGERYMYVYGLMLDFFETWALDGIFARYPTNIGPEDALPLIARDRTILRGFNELPSSLRVRLRRAVDDLRLMGNAFPLHAQLRGYLTGFGVLIRTVNDRGSWQSTFADLTDEIVRLALNWNWDGRYPVSARTRFWPIIYPLATGLWEIEDPWGPDAAWGDGGVWGFTATRDQVESIRAIVGEWRPQGTRVPNTIVAFDDDSFDPSGAPGAPLPDGTWRNYGTLVAGVYRPGRLRTARYLEGTS